MPFSEDHIPDLAGKIIIVTGGNSGIGKQTVAVLASKGAKVYLAARSKDKFNKAVEDIRTSHPDATNGQIEFLKLDLGTAKGARDAAEDFKTRESALHVLYNNAGIMGSPSPKGSLSPDGYELQWQTNVFGPFVFTYGLMPLLSSTAASSPPGTVRIINTASDGAAQAPKTGIPLADETVGAQSGKFACYGHSKIANILVTRQLAKRYPEIWSFAPHPGPVQSELTRNVGIPGPIMWVLDRVLFKPVQYGALTQLYAGTASDIDESQNGSYLIPLAKFESKLPHPQAGDDAFGEKVWEWNISAMQKAGVL
ncbi:NAD(P)-binding protein [Athelia psychrophila]|uniref:NAD(P)-binding protein n=1 Tax=Athelia psychrophila TaxID=1759441 RepID=A0A166WF96_9AGAM|nr:NAD(P)-binding protein [Fibularhizoctonia sp. CBS 109695]